MSLTNPNKVVTEQRLSEFYGDILPYLGGMPDVCGGGFAPIGTIIAFMGTTAPQDYLACDGTTYNISAYPRLAQFITDQFGSANYFGGDGVTTFKVPDLRGEFLRGTGTNSHTNQGNGANVGTHQDATSLRTDLLLKSNSTDVWQYVYLDGNTPDEGLVDAKYTDKFESASPQMMAMAKYTMQPAQESGNVYRTTRPTNTSILWCIKAVEPGLVYSTDERIVGTWIDGKPLYQKTIIDVLPSATADGGADAVSYIDIGASVEHIGIIDSYFITSNLVFPLPYYSGNYKVNIISRLNGASSDNNKIGVYNNRVAFNGVPIHITLQYTKTL